MSKSCRSLHLWIGSSSVRFWIPWSLQALHLQNVCLRRQRFSGTYTPAGYWWSHWPRNRPDKNVAELTCFSLQQVYLHCSTSLCLAAPGRNCEPACFRKLKSERLVLVLVQILFKKFNTSIQSYYVCVFLCRERGNDHREESWTQCCGYCGTRDHFCPQDLRKKKACNS